MVSKSFAGILPLRPQHALLQQLHQQVANVLRWLCTTSTRKTPSVQWLWQGLSRNINCTFNWHPLKKKKKHGCLHHHHWWRLTAEMPQPFLQRAGTAVAKCLRVGVWKTVGCCHWKAVKKTVYIYILWYIKIYIHVTCLRKKHIKNDNDKLLQQ